MLIFVIIISPHFILARPLELAEEASLTQMGLKNTWGTSSGTDSIFIRISVALEDFSLSTGPCGGEIIQLEGCHFWGEAGAPRVPFVTKQLALPQGQIPVGLEVVEYKLYRIRGQHSIAPEPSPLPTSGGASGSSPCSPNPKIYNSSAPYPGKIAMINAGTGAKELITGYLRFLPIQVTPLTEEVYLVQEALIKVFLKPVIKPPSKLASGKKSMFSSNAQNIIICADSLSSIADSFKALHESYGVETYVATVESIEANYDVIPGPSTTIFPGWTDEQPEFIEGYDWDRARKIISYLRDYSAHPTLESITLLGDADVVPPSYYYNNNYHDDDRFEDFYPTDYLYISYDYDQVPNIGCGRLPVHSVAQAKEIYDKLKRFYNNLDVDIFKRVACFGGDGFQTWAPSSQHTKTSMINLLTNSGLSFHKKFYTDSLHNAEKFFATLESDSFGIINYTGHGNMPGFGFSHWEGFWDYSFFFSYSWFGMDEIDALPVNLHPPIFLTGACHTAAYDAEIVEEVIGTTFVEKWIRDDQGGIGYWGSTRYGWGRFTYVDSDHYTIAHQVGATDGVLFCLLYAFNQNANTLGELDLIGRNEYIYESSDYSYKYSYMLGGFFDAGLYIPTINTVSTRQSEPCVSLPTADRIIEHSDHSPGVVYLLAPGESLPIDFSASGPVEVRISDAHFQGPNLLIDTAFTSPYEFDPPFDQVRMYLARFINEDNLETTIFFYAGRESLVVDGSKDDWDELHYDPVAKDKDDIELQKFELRDLYIADDDDYYYFGFHCWGAEEDESEDYGYILAIDSKEGGYSGTPAETRDPFYCKTAFPEGQAPDYFIFSYREERYSLGQRPTAYIADSDLDNFYKVALQWRGGNLYSNRHLPDAFMHGWEDGNFRWWFEFQVGKDMLGNPDSINVVLYSVKGLYSDTFLVDCIPSNPDITLLNNQYTYKNGQDLSAPHFITIPNDTILTPGDTLSALFYATHLDNDTAAIEYTISTAPEGAYIDDGYQIIWLSDTEGIYKFILTACDDDGNCDTCKFVVTVAENVVCGAISGTWDSTHSPYYIGCNVMVLTGDSLYIGPGVEVIFTGHYDFRVSPNALLKAIGTAEDSIIFTAANTFPTAPTHGHNSIRLYNTAEGCTLSFCKIEYGHPTSSGSATAGGAINCQGSDLVIMNCTIANNDADFGGAIACRESSPTIINTKITNNRANNYGGGIHIAECDADIINNQITQNSASEQGGAIYSYSSISSITANWISHNVSYVEGGGISLNASTLHITNNFISQNIGYSGGGGVDCYRSNPILINNTITENFAENRAGGLFCEYNSDPVLFNTILWSNSADDDEEIYLNDYYSPCTLLVAYCNIDSNKCGVEEDAGIILWEYGNIDSNPNFTGPNYHLSESSPCKDAGAEYIVTKRGNVYAPTVDFEGQERPCDTDWDIGADEISADKIGTGRAAYLRTTKLDVYPDPFRVATTIQLELRQQELPGKYPTVEIFDIFGNKISELATTRANGNANILLARWAPGSDLPSGLYLLHVKTRQAGINKRVLYLK